MLLFALVLALLQLGCYSGVQCQQPISATTTNSSELQRLREDVTEVKESIKDLRSLLQDQLAQIRESLGDVERKVTLEVKQCILNCDDDDEILTCTPPPKVSISPIDGTPTAGESFSLTCSVTLGDGGSLIEDLIVQWEAPVDINTDNDIQVITADSTGTRTSVLQFNILRTSHGGQYTCKATTTTGNDTATETLTLQIPPPTLAITRDPDTSVILHPGDFLALTCTIRIDPAVVDSGIEVNGSLSGPGGRPRSTTMRFSAGMYRIILDIPSLQATPSDTYTCAVAVEPTPRSVYVQGSKSHSNLDITMGRRQPFILFSNRRLIQMADLNGGGQQVVVNNSGMISILNAVDVDFDARKDYLFWSDIMRQQVMRARIDGSEVMTVIDSGLSVPDGIAYDWVNEKLYLTDAEQHKIEVVDLGGSGDRRILLKTGNQSFPRAIVLDPTTRWMYWTDWGTPAKIEKASLDGLNRTVIHSTDLTWPNALTIDYENQDLYWADAMLDKLETSKVDGSIRRLLLDRSILHPFSITFFEGYLYWTDWILNAILAAPVNSPNQNRHILIQLQDDPMGIEIVSRDRQPKAPNPCAADNGNCSSLCLLSAVAKEGYTCACPQGMELAPNMRDCQK